MIEEAIVHLGQELEDDAFLRPQEDHCVVFMGARPIVHNDARQTIPEWGIPSKINQPVNQSFNDSFCPIEEHVCPSDVPKRSTDGDEEHQ